MSALSADFIGLAEIRARYGLEAFVETGCESGHALRYAKGLGFSRLYSCDIREAAVRQAQGLVPGAEILVQTSCDFLKDLLPRIDTRTAFWLDAHLPHVYGVRDHLGRISFPLRDELTLIRLLKPSYVRDVIICDDMRIYQDERNPCYQPFDLPAGHGKVADFTTLFVDFLATHTVEFRSEQEGVMILSPKR